jgi:hypothetical protein
MKNNNRKPTHGGARQNSGRPPKQDKEIWGQITCVLRHDTIEKIRAGAGSRFFGEYLQDHLDRYPPPDRATYQARLNREPLIVKIKRRKVPVMVSAGSANRVRRVPKPLEPKLAAWLERYAADDQS